MGFAKVQSAQPYALSAHLVDIEIDITNGLHTFTIIGLGDKAVEESRERVSAALKYSGVTPPKQKNEKVTVSLAPAHIRKQGTFFDLAIAVGYLAASSQIHTIPKTSLFIGELSLDGNVRRAHGVLPITQKAVLAGYKTIYVPSLNAVEAASVSGISVIAISTLKELIEHLQGVHVLHPHPSTKITHTSNHANDFAFIHGQAAAKRAAILAAAGWHNIALFGPPGTGKTLLAKAIPQLLPPLSHQEVLEVSSIHSAAGTIHNTLCTTRPFEAPHHSSSFVSIIGGGSNVQPGAITRAHRGVLLLDEFPEFDRRAIESLRQPLEERQITIARANGSVQFPASCIVVATFNPCPCGYHNHKTKPCTCTNRQIQQYQRKLSGPILDRIDMWVHMEDVAHQELLTVAMHKKPDHVHTSIRHAYTLAMQRQGYPNAHIPSSDILALCALTQNTKHFLEHAAQRLNMSARSVHNVLRVARTAADFDSSPTVEQQHILEALSYRKT